MIRKGTTPRRAGLFRGREPQRRRRRRHDVAKGDVVAVTLERAGGVDAPTTTPLVASTPV